jgi:hypothetical protein
MGELVAPARVAGCGASCTMAGGHGDRGCSGHKPADIWVKSLHRSQGWALQVQSQRRGAGGLVARSQGLDCMAATGAGWIVWMQQEQGYGPGWG